MIGEEVFVTYAVQDPTGTAPLTCPRNGIVDIYALDGSFVRRFASLGPLNAPWGIAKASAEFGAFSNDILIGNFGDGTINAFDPQTGEFAGRLKDETGSAIVNPGLLGMAFGEGSSGDSNTLYFTAGLRVLKHGLFGAISVSNTERRGPGRLEPMPENENFIVPCRIRLQARP